VVTISFSLAAMLLGLIRVLLSITELERIDTLSLTDEMKRINATFLQNPDFRNRLTDVFPLIEEQLLIIRNDVIRAKEESRSIEPQDIAHFFRVTELIRNVVAQHPHNQNLASKTQIHVYVLEIMQRIEPLSTATLEAAFRMGIQMYSNVMTDNVAVQDRIWPTLVDSKILLVGLNSKEAKTTRSTLIAVYNCVHAHSGHSSILFGSKFSSDIVRSLLALCDRFVDNEKDIHFELSVALLTCGLESDLFPKFWSFCHLNEHRVALLKLLDGYAHTTMQVPGTMVKNDTCLEMLQILKKAEEEFELSQEVPRQLFYTVQFWCTISNQFHSEASLWFDSGIHIALISKID
jgi:hypothetical protein